VSLVKQVPVPSRATELAGLSRVDYADAFTVPVATDRPPEEWIRRLTVRMPGLFAVVRVAHRTLGLKLVPADGPDHVIGWDILRSTDNEAVLGTAGALGGPRIVGLSSPGHVVISTLITLKSRRARAMWSIFATLHRAVARRALTTLSSLAEDLASREHSSRG
jgi:hypothetical protein